MTRDEAEARGRRALAAGFDMQEHGGVLGCRWDDSPHPAHIEYRFVLGIDPPVPVGLYWPDFRDPATVGVLRAQVAERVLARGSRAFWTEYEPANEEWHPMHSWGMPHGTGQDSGPVCGPEETEVDALLAALEVGR